MENSVSRPVISRIHLFVDERLRPLLRATHADGVVAIRLERKASVKDVVESLGIPHTEVARLTINGREQGFGAILADNDQISVLSFSGPEDIYRLSVLRPPFVRPPRFLVDVNVGKLARLLRLLGFDTIYRPEATDRQLAEMAGREKWVLLTRDATLLKRNLVIHGRLVRASQPWAQVEEIVRLYGLAADLRPFSRCLVCNSLLMPVPKEEIVSRLEPLTKKYYDTFSICPGCARLYWRGTHQERMEGEIGRLRKRLAAGREGEQRN